MTFGHPDLTHDAETAASPPVGEYAILKTTRVHAVVIPVIGGPLEKLFKKQE